MPNKILVFSVICISNIFINILQYSHLNQTVNQKQHILQGFGPEKAFSCISFS